MTDKARDEMLDVRSAAALAGCHPETVRRWVWAGRIEARREGGRLLIAREDVEALAGTARVAMSLAAWEERARSAHQSDGATGSRRSAADLVLDDRGNRSR